VPILKPIGARIIFKILGCNEVAGSGLVVDYTITIGNLIEIASILGGGVLVLMALKGDVSSLKTGARELRHDFSEMQLEIKKIGDVLVTQADQNRRIMHLEEDVRDLRRGRGFIRTVPGQQGIDGEYP
jgi:hypothetical protein